MYTDDELFDYFVEKAGDNAVPYFEQGRIGETYFAYRGTISQYTEFVLSVARHLEMHDSVKVEQAMSNVTTYTAAGHEAECFQESSYPQNNCKHYGVGGIEIMGYIAFLFGFIILVLTMFTLVEVI